MRMRLPQVQSPETGLRARVAVPHAESMVRGAGSLERDPHIGQIFRHMRAATRLSREALARHLATTPSTIEDLESGALASLPHWGETARIVRSYCQILRLDHQPILWHMQNRLEAAGARVDPPTGANQTRPPGPPPAVLRGGSTPVRPPERARRRARAMFALSAPLVVTAAALYISHAMPAPVYRAIGLLPSPVSGTARAAMDSLVLYAAPTRDGLRWVDVGDPQLRKVDKLQPAAR